MNTILGSIYSIGKPEWRSTRYNLGNDEEEIRSSAPVFFKGWGESSFKSYRLLFLAALEWHAFALWMAFLWTRSLVLKTAQKYPPHVSPHFLIYQFMYEFAVFLS